MSCYQSSEPAAPESWWWCCCRSAEMGEAAGQFRSEEGVAAPPLLPSGQVQLMSSMMSSAGQPGTPQSWQGAASQYQQGFGQSSPHTYPYVYGYRYPHYDNSPYWYRGYPAQTSESDSEAPPPPQPPAIYPWMRETKSSRSSQFSSSSSFAQAQASSSSDKSEPQTGEMSPPQPGLSWLILLQVTATCRTARRPPRGPGRPTPAANWWSWRRSSTSTDICVDPGQWSGQLALYNCIPLPLTSSIRKQFIW